jgi:hypothetical protein
MVKAVSDRRSGQTDNKRQKSLLINAGKLRKIDKKIF